MHVRLVQSTATRAALRSNLSANYVLQRFPGRLPVRLSSREPSRQTAVTTGTQGNVFLLLRFLCGLQDYAKTNQTVFNELVGEVLHLAAIRALSVFSPAD